MWFFNFPLIVLIGYSASRDNADRFLLFGALLTQAAAKCHQPNSSASTCFPSLCWSMVECHPVVSPTSSNPRGHSTPALRHFILTLCTMSTFGSSQLRNHLTPTLLCNHILQTTKPPAQPFGSFCSWWTLDFFGHLVSQKLTTLMKLFAMTSSQEHVSQHPTVHPSAMDQVWCSCFSGNPSMCKTTIMIWKSPKSHRTIQIAVNVESFLFILFGFQFT